MGIRDRVARLVAELPPAPQFPTQGATLFIDLERREVQRGYTPLRVVKTLLAGRGSLLTPIAAPIAFLPVKQIANGEEWETF